MTDSDNLPRAIKRKREALSETLKLLTQSQYPTKLSS